MSLGNKLRRCEEESRMQRETYEQRIKALTYRAEVAEGRVSVLTLKLTRYRGLYEKYLEWYTDPQTDVSVLEDREHPMQQLKRMILL